MNCKWFIVGSLFVWLVVIYLMGIVDIYNEVFFFCVLMGISEVFYIFVGLLLIVDYYFDKLCLLVIGIYMIGFYIGQVIGGFGVIVVVVFFWYIIFYWFGIVGIVYVVILMFFLYEKKDRI